MLKLFMCLGFLFIVVSGPLAFLVGSVEPLCRNIIYVHVPPAIGSLVCFGVLFVCSVQYLRTGRVEWDYLAVSSAEVGLILATVLNATGMIFARAEWNAWWTPSPRLVSSGLLWFLYVAYCLLRTGFAGEVFELKIRAVFGIVAFIDVPIVFVSARFIDDIHRAGFGFESIWQILALALAVAGILMLAVVLIWIRANLFKAYTGVIDPL